MKFLILFISIFTYFLSIFAEEKPVTTSKGLYLKTKQEIQEWKNSARYALVIGVNDYLNMNRLKFAAGDAKKMYLSLKQVGEFQEVVLMNDFQEKDSLKPYYNNIMKQYKRLIDKNPSLLLIYFSGHGFMNVKGENVVATLNSDVKQNKEVLNLTSLIKQAKDKGIGQVVFFVDACREQLEEGKKNVRKSQSFSKIREEAVNAKGWAIMVGTSPGDYSYEDNELNSGIFSHFLVEGLNGGFQKEGGLYEYLTFQDLKNYVDKKMRKYIKKSNREKQKPYIVGDFTGDFLISTRVPENSIRYEKYLIGQDRDNKYIRILYDTKQRKIEEAFFTITDAREYIKADVNGIARISFDYGKSYFKASQYNLKGEFIFEHGLSIEKNKIILKYSGGQKFYKEVYDKNLLLLNKTEYKDKADKIGTTIFIKRTGSLLYSMEESFYKDEKYTQKIVNEEGIFKIKYKFLNGNLIEKSYYDDSENFKKDKWGIAKYEYKYKGAYRILEAYYNEKNKLTPGQEGIAKYTFTYQEDKLLETRLYNEEDKLLQDEERIAIIKNTYRDKNLIDTRYFNGDGKPLENSYGYARIRYKYDSKSKRIEEKFYNRNDELIKEGIAFKLYSYSSSGEKLGEAYFDHKNKLYSDRFFRIAKYTYLYDEKGRKIKEEYYGRDGAFLETEACKKVFNYDSEGKLVSEIYLDKNNQKSQNAGQVSEIKYMYYKQKSNKRTLLKEKVFIDLAGKPLSSGVSRIRFTYNERGILLGEEKIYGDKRIYSGDYRLLYTLPNNNRIIELNLDSYYRPYKLSFLELTHHNER